MIIVRLQGGLGNQLFQYAAGKALSVRTGSPFKLETITSLQKDKKRYLALNDVQAEFEMAGTKELKKFVSFPRLYRHKPSFFSIFGKNIYREPRFHFDEKFFKLKTPVFLDGFWQSPLYFQDIESIIRKDFTIKKELIKEVVEKGNELENIPSVAVHIRRGDFLSQKAKTYHGILDAAYYDNAIGLISQKRQRVSLQVFSDDIEWVKQHLNFPANTEFISSHSRAAIEDFYLMSKCSHNIIANSSFSWWAAWLNNNPDKMVIAPKNWFADSRINTNDLIPGGWIRI